MIKFFRRIRQQLLSQNRFSKYMLYAIGEIILVIIGILIALNLNKKAEQKQAEAKVDAILEDVLKELEIDINEGTRLIYGYRLEDSLCSLVLNKKVTLDDYLATGENAWRLRSLVTGWNNYEINDDAYKLLIDNIDVIPDGYNQVVTSLKKLHNKFKPDVVEFNQMVKTLVNRNFDDYQEKFEWYGKSDSISNMEFINYMLHDFNYINKVKRHQVEATWTHRGAIAEYRMGAVIAYKEIAKVLDKSIDTLNFIISLKALQKRVGIYSNINIPEDRIELFLKKGYLVTKEMDKYLNHVIPLDSDNDFYLEWNGLVRFKSSDNKDFMTIYIGHEAKEYIKVDEKPIINYD